MDNKVFAEHGKFKLVCDERDIRVKVWERYIVWEWCKENNIEVEYQGTLADTDVWRVRDEQHRVMFMLRWL